MHVSRRSRRTWIIVVAAVVVLVVGAGGAAALYLGSLAQRFDSGTEKIVEAFPEETLRPPEPTGPAASAQNILLLGSDLRGDIDSIDDIAGQRSDTMMVAHVSADRQNVTVMSIMRDSWVDIPGHGEAKINAALSYGGVPLAVQVVETLIGARIDHIAIVDFESFKGLTDAVGGVDVDNPKTFESTHLSGHTFPQGVVHMNGEEALAFARERYAFADGDYQRVRNQQIFMKAVISKVLSADTALNPGRLSEVIDAVAPYLTVDAGLTSGYAAQLGFELREVRQDDISFFTVPTLGTGTSADGQSIVLLDEAGIAEVQAAFRDDTLAALTAAQ